MSQLSGWTKPIPAGVEQEFNKVFGTTPKSKGAESKGAESKGAESKGAESKEGRSEAIYGNGAEGVSVESIRASVSEPGDVEPPKGKKKKLKQLVALSEDCDVERIQGAGTCFQCAMKRAINETFTVRKSKGLGVDDPILGHIASIAGHALAICTVIGSMSADAVNDQVETIAATIRESVLHNLKYLRADDYKAMRSLYEE